MRANVAGDASPAYSVMKLLSGVYNDYSGELLLDGGGALTGPLGTRGGATDVTDSDDLLERAYHGVHVL